MSKKIRCIIIDDEVSNRIVLRELIRMYCESITIVAEVENIRAAEKVIVELQPDVIFLDIQMPGGNGFDLLEKIKNRCFEVIFTTSYDKYAIKAFKYSALDYLLKPIEISELVRTVNILENKIAENSANHQVITLLDNLKKEDLSKKLAVQNNDKVKFIKTADIIMFEADRNYTKIYAVNTDLLLSSKTLKFYEELLEDNPFFFRVSKTHLANTNYITEYSKSEPCVIYLTNGAELEISRRRKSEFLEKMKS